MFYFLCLYFMLCVKSIINLILYSTLLLFIVSGLFATPWTVALQAPLFMGVPRQQYWSGLPFPSPGDLPGPASLALAGFTTEPPGKPRADGIS